MWRDFENRATAVSLATAQQSIAAVRSRSIKIMVAALICWLGNASVVQLKAGQNEPLAWKNTSLITGVVADEIKALKQQKRDPLRCIGSIRLVKSLAKLGLVDRFRLMVFPLILGEKGRSPSMPTLKLSSQ
jgi:riboflavin biosynthesis pyrimidine reductase